MASWLSGLQPETGRRHMTITTPWWSPLAVAAIGLAGVVIGVLATWMNEGRRWNREEQRRIQVQEREEELQRIKDRREAYTELLTQAMLVGWATVLDAQIRAGTDKETDPQIAAKKIEEHLTALIQWGQKTALIATPAAAKQAEQLMEAAVQAGQKPPGWIREAAGAFLATARAELGSDLPPATTNPKAARVRQR